MELQRVVQFINVFWNYRLIQGKFFFLSRHFSAKMDDNFELNITFTVRLTGVIGANVCECNKIIVFWLFIQSHWPRAIRELLLQCNYTSGTPFNYKK